tara:strand:+ start:485 stop:916 length:432 start_codon:yes stop_codon:yes gene_type:complete
MKLKMIFIYICAFSWGALYANPLIDAYDGLEPMATKFLVMGAVVPFIAIYMLFQDENQKNPTKFDIAVTVLLSMILVWLGYEVSLQTVIPMWLGLILSFILGLFSLNLVLLLRTKIFGKAGLIDRLFKELGNYIAKKLGNGQE